MYLGYLREPRELFQHASWCRLAGTSSSVPGTSFGRWRLKLAAFRQAHANYEEVVLSRQQGMDNGHGGFVQFPAFQGAVPEWTLWTPDCIAPGCPTTWFAGATFGSIGRVHRLQNQPFRLWVGSRRGVFSEHICWRPLVLSMAVSALST